MRKLHEDSVSWQTELGMGTVAGRLGVLYEYPQLSSVVSRFISVIIVCGGGVGLGCLLPD